VTAALVILSESGRIQSHLVKGNRRRTLCGEPIAADVVTTYTGQVSCPRCRLAAMAKGAPGLPSAVECLPLPPWSECCRRKPVAVLRYVPGIYLALCPAHAIGHPSTLVDYLPGART
jgi:hypothetical protein